MIPPPFPKEECLMPARFGPPHQFPDCLQNARSSFGAVLSASRHAPSLVVALLSVTALLVSNGCQSKQAAPPTSPPDVNHFYVGWARRGRRLLAGLQWVSKQAGGAPDEPTRRRSG